MADETPNEPDPNAAEEPREELTPAAAQPPSDSEEPPTPTEADAAADDDEIVDTEAVVVPSDDDDGPEVDVEATLSEDGVLEVQEPEEVEEDDDFDEVEPRVKPAIPGMDLEVDIVTESGRERPAEYDEDYDPDAESEDAEEDDDVVDDQPIAATISLAGEARYRATGKRKTAVARVILKPGTGAYSINGRTLDEFFPRDTLRRTIRQPLEAVAYDTRMDVVARMHGGGVSAQAGALRHGISRALLEADPNLRGELKRRGFLTRDARVKERKKAGLKKARKRPQFSKR